MYNVYPYPFDVILWCSTDKENVAFAPSEYDISIDKIYIVASCNDDCFGFFEDLCFLFIFGYIETLELKNVIWTVLSLVCGNGGKGFSLFCIVPRNLLP